MGTVIPFPARKVLDEELAVQLWELVMAGRIDSPEYRRLDAEIARRRHLAGHARPRPWAGPRRA
ncbi:hypothetical protein [Arenimonas fontis]|uniref:Addiction module protein n=1 Tax=Arenimonas fontis TaxID=2608255 RepID=A0A5B2ZB27_9GAMM|nr:hypothetical protein [Arenimonas fontis]KAA2284470.1 hypothetical protein F0415_09090 [Arenimonas fontis]